jgi:hypothetical protein
MKFPLQFGRRKRILFDQKGKFSFERGWISGRGEEEVRQERIAAPGIFFGGRP